MAQRQYTDDDVRLVAATMTGIALDQWGEVDRNAGRRETTVMRPGGAFFVLDNMLEMLIPVAKKLERLGNDCDEAVKSLAIEQACNQELVGVIRRLKAERGPGISSYEYKGRRETTVSCQGDYLEDWE